MTSPDGNSSREILQMQEKAQQWVDAVGNGHLHRRNVWFLLGVQFWLQVGYSLCTSMATFEELGTSLQKQYYQILPLGGVVRTAPFDCKMINPGFYCPGLPHPGVEARINMSKNSLCIMATEQPLAPFSGHRIACCYLSLACPSSPYKVCINGSPSWQCTHG